MLKVYLAGCSVEKTYRTAVKQQYANDIDFDLVDPFDFHPEGQCSVRTIVEGDKKLILDCDAVVVKVDQYSAGTMMEIIFAWTNNIPVFLISSNGKVRYDTWIVYHIEARFSAFSECFEYLRQFEDKIKKMPLEMMVKKGSEIPEVGTKEKSEETEIIGFVDNESEWVAVDLDLQEKIEKENEEYAMAAPKNCLPDSRDKNYRYGLDDSKVATKLLDKNCSPMIIRKYTRLGFPLYIHLICDESLSDLDNIVHDAIDISKKQGLLENDIQSLRNFTGFLSDAINEYYDKKKRGCVESLAVIYYVDKMMITSLQGDCMNHDSCRRELYECINIMTKI